MDIMTMSLLEIVQQRVPGQPHPNPEFNALYVQEIDRIIKNVYFSRYKSLEPKISPSVNFETFANQCWDRLEDEGGLQSLQTRTFRDDAHLCRYIKIYFQQNLQELIYQQTPGKETRVRQIRILMKRFCVIKKIQKKRFWHMNTWNGYPHAEMNTEAELNKLEATLDRLRPPEAVYPKRADSRYGMEIPGNQMEAYLKALFLEAGGIISENALIAFIARYYHIIPSVVEESLDATDSSAATEISADDKEEDIFSAIISDGFLFVEMRDAVKKFVGILTDRQKAIFKLIYADEKNQTAAARMLGISNAAMSNEVKKLNTILSDFVSRNMFQIAEFEQFMEVCKMEITNLSECVS
jgi:predicted DNA-binding protein YlxM (UPF0122 family)